MAYTRENPSVRYRGLLEQYRRLHEEGERFLGIAAQDTFPGQSLLPQAQRIKRLIALTGALTILDYGCGKGRQYRPMPIRFPGTPGEWESVADYWDVDNVVLYDPGFAPFAKRPQETFDGVVCTDVLEHCPEEDLPWIVGDLFGFAQRFVFANVACFPARKRLPSGENAHCTLRPAPWWRELFEGVARRHPGLVWETWLMRLDSRGARVEERIGSEAAKIA